MFSEIYDTSDWFGDEPKLNDACDYRDWFVALQFNAHSAGIWDHINPNGSLEGTIDPHEKEPTFESVRDQEIERRRQTKILKQLANDQKDGQSTDPTPGQKTPNPSETTIPTEDMIPSTKEVGELLNKAVNYYFATSDYRIQIQLG